MKLKGRSILVICLLVFGGYAVYEYFHEKNVAEKEMYAARLMTVDFDQVNEIELKKGTQLIQLKRDIDGWTMTAPVQDLADNTAVEDLIKGMATERIIEVAHEGDDVNWKVYGLDQPLGQITVKATSGKSNTFVISEKRNFEENAFARRDDENRVLVLNSIMQTRLEKLPAEFRDMRLLRHKIASVDRVSLKNDHGSFVIERVDGQWVRASADKTELDQNKVREFLSQLASAKGADMVEGSAKLPALKSMMTIDLVMDGKNWNAQVGQAKDFLIYATTSEPKQSMRLAAGALDNLIKMKISDLKTSAPAAAVNPAEKKE